MRKLVSILSILLFVALAAACGTDDPAASANNADEVDAGADAIGQGDATDGGGSDATDGGGDEDATDGGDDEDATDGGGGGDGGDGGDDPDGGDADGGDNTPTECTSDDDCPIGEICYIDRSSGSVEMYCRAGNDGGGGLGNICTADVGCEANLCLEDRFRDVCSNPCDDDADCNAAGYECGTASVDDGAGGSIDLSVCVASDPAPCDSNDDCDPGTNCAVVPNLAGDALESVCVPEAGGLATGAQCSDDSECDSLVCLADHCAAPCELSNQCATGQRCEANTILKDSLSGAFNVCETPPDERCDQTGTCSDGVRVCSEIRTASSGGREAYCQFPDSSAPESLGGHCTQSSDCREQLCLAGNSDECTVICVDNNQCAAGQICTTYNVGSTQLGFCNRGCSDDNDCAGLDFTDGNGDLVEHLCMVNENTREGGADQVCLRKNLTDTNGDPAGDLGASCGSGGGADCESGLCLRTVSFDGTPCSSASQCQSGQVCEQTDSGDMQCGDTDFQCSRVCDDNADCSTGVSGNELTACSSNVSITFNSGVTDTVSMCAKPQ